MFILGISALYHDAAAALIKDGKIIAAAQEERFSRKKHDAAFPTNAIRFCMNEGGISEGDLECIVYYENPLLVANRFVQNIKWLGQESKPLIQRSFGQLTGQRLWIHKMVERELGGFGRKGKLLVSEHHISHAASAFYPSPYEKAIIMTIDGVGEWASTTIGVGEGNRISLKEEIRYPDSIGLLYSAFTWFCGFKVNSGDYKFMGLAPYGEPVYYDAIREHVIDIKADGSYRLNMDYFDYWRGGTMINEEKFTSLFHGGRRKPESLITRREMNIAASVQKIVEEIMVLMARHAKGSYGKGIDHLVLAGGVALNCVSNGKLLKEQIFKDIWIQPAAGDAGGALGAALQTYYMYYRQKRNVEKTDSQQGSYLGPSFSQDDTLAFLKENKIPYEQYLDKTQLFQEIAKKLEEQKVIGLFWGKMEFGPRALGNRSIIADPRSETMQSKLNLKIKYRESFRPFAPSVLEERAADYFDLRRESPYMLLVDCVKKERQISYDLKKALAEEKDNLLPIVNKKRSDISAVTHVDYSARIQTVNKERNGDYYDLIKEFEKRTGCGVIVNTSFNVRGEPIVCTPRDAYRCFMRTEMDVLVLGNCLLYKEGQPVFVDVADWRSEYELD